MGGCHYTRTSTSGICADTIIFVPLMNFKRSVQAANLVIWIIFGSTWPSLLLNNSYLRRNTGTGATHGTWRPHRMVLKSRLFQLRCVCLRGKPLRASKHGAHSDCTILIHLVRSIHYQSHIHNLNVHPCFSSALRPKLRLRTCPSARSTLAPRARDCIRHRLHLDETVPRETTDPQIRLVRDDWRCSCMLRLS